MKAIAMMSGGLDSMLAAKIIKDMGIDVIGLYCSMPFSLRDKSASQPGGSLLQKFSAQTGIDLRVLDITDDFLIMLKHPKFGYGAHLNPCIDCKILMFKKARQLMQEWGASFLVSGEVVGQRPMSQQRRTMQQIDSQAQIAGLLLRPLSAKLLEETIAEKQGWVRRHMLYDFSGRSRKPQTDLAVMRGIIEFHQPAGGCLLTDPHFSDRLTDLMKRDKLDVNNISLLKRGRHYRVGADGRLIVGRDERDNRAIEQLAQPGDFIFCPSEEIAGPTALGRGIGSDEDIAACCGIVCRYCDLNGKPDTAIAYGPAGSECRYSRVAAPFTEEELVKIRI
ncbi:MAG: tRNA 4-thiouridine(8) synthase ThiI [Candidatus Omnitrophota bacterium]